MTRIALAILFASALATASAEAHHSHADFALDRDATVVGTIEGIRFQNPHVLIVVRTDGSTTYTAEWQGAQWLESHPELVAAGAARLTSSTLKLGDRVVLVGNPARDTALRTLIIKELRRPSDGWQWSCHQTGIQRAC